jgi:hypothetical protein
MYEDYYMSQSGRGGSVFSGSRGQRGHGLGSMLSGLFRSAMPMIKQGLSAFGKQALRSGAQIVSDVADGENFGDAFKKRAREGIKEFVSPIAGINQSGSGKRRSKRKSNKSIKKSIKKRKRFNDIFV